MVKSLVAHTCSPALGKQRQEYQEVKARIGGKDRERRGEKKKGEEKASKDVLIWLFHSLD